jgi:glycosyltransferase involved in cell wall biosynthesis
VHVLVIPSWYPKHPAEIAGSFFREQAIALKKRGCSVGVIHPDRRAIRYGQNLFQGRHGIEETIDCGVPTLRFHGIEWFSPLPRVGRWRWVKDGLRLYDCYTAKYGVPDIVHAHSVLFGGLLAAAIKKKSCVPFVITEHRSAFALGQIKEWQMKAPRAAASLAAERFAVSEAFCSVLYGCFGPSVGRWKTMPNIASDLFTRRALRYNSRSENRFVFVTVGHLVKGKGIGILVEAFSRAFSSDQTVSLVVIGEGVERYQLERQVDALGLTHRVRFFGEARREQVVEALLSADAFVLSSFYETFGVAVVEALALGKPVIATRCGGPDSIVRSRDGLLVEPGDVGSLATAMNFMRTNYDKYDPHEIRRACVARFGEDVISSKLLAAYEEILLES